MPGRKSRHVIALVVAPDDDAQGRVGKDLVGICFDRCIAFSKQGSDFVEIACGVLAFPGQEPQHDCHRGCGIFPVGSYLD